MRSLRGGKLDGGRVSFSVELTTPAAPYFRNVARLVSFPAETGSELAFDSRGSVSAQAPRPCVAAYRMREHGSMVRPGTSTLGRFTPASVQATAGAPTPPALRRTPKSVAA